MRLGCDPRGVQEVIRDKSGEPLAVALAALGMQPADAARIFLSSEPNIAHSVDRIRTLTRIASDLSINAAQRFLSAMLGQSLASDAPRHRRYEQAAEIASLAVREMCCGAPVRIRQGRSRRRPAWRSNAPEAQSYLARSTKARPSGSSISTIHRSRSKSISRLSRRSASCGSTHSPR
jgi:hypothetical protein